MKNKILSRSLNLLSPLVVAAIILSWGVRVTLAVDDLGAAALIHEAGNIEKQASRSAMISQKRLTEIIAHADSMITNRITTLNTLTSRIQNDSRLTAAEKSTFQGQVQNVISGLTNLKTKIDADTTADTALADAKQIVTTYRVYAEMEPQIRILITLKNLKETVIKVQDTASQLQNLINALQSQGKNVSALIPLLTDINTKLQHALTTIDTDTASVAAMTPATTDPQNVIKQVRSDIQNVIKTDIENIRQDIAQMRQVFRSFPVAVPSPTTTITPTPIP